MVSLGYDPIWFGILLMVLLEMALITPPIGINLYVIQGIRDDINFNDVAIGSAPFVFAMALTVLALIAYPQLTLWLPDFVSGL